MECVIPLVTLHADSWFCNIQYVFVIGELPRTLQSTLYFTLYYSVMFCYECNRVCEVLFPWLL